MAESGTDRMDDPAGTAMPAQREPARLPAVVRFASIILLGAALAGLTSYLLRTIGF